MVYIVQADLPDSNDAVSITLSSGEDALAVARRWAADGNKGVRIIGDGRIYFVEEFERTIRKT